MKGIHLFAALALGAILTGTASAQVPTGSTPFQTLLTVQSDSLASYKNTGSSVVTLTQAFYVQGSQNGQAYTPSPFVDVLTDVNGVRNGEAILFTTVEGVVNSDSTAPFRFVLQPGDEIILSPIGGQNAVAQATLVGYTTPKPSSLDWQGDILLEASISALTVSGSYTNTTTHSQLITDFSFVNETLDTNVAPFSYVRCYTQAPVAGKPGTFATTGSFAEPALTTYLFGSSFRTKSQNFILAPGQRLLMQTTRQSSGGANSVRLTLSGTEF